MYDLDPQVAELLAARTPPPTVDPAWEDVLRRAGHRRSARRRRHVPAGRWLLLAAALAVPAGIAAATARHQLVDYLSGGATQHERHEIAPYVRGFASDAGIHADLSRMRRLVAVTVGGHRHLFVMAPLTRRQRRLHVRGRRSHRGRG